MSVVLDPNEWEPVSSDKIEIKRVKNTALTNELVKHIFDNLGITAERRSSVVHEIFQSSKTLSFTDDSGKQKVPVFACQVQVDGKKFEIASVKLSDKEAVCISRLEGCPIYGSYFGEECLIGVMAKDRWLEASMFIQASFLAGMEQLREVGSVFTALPKADEMFEHIKQFLMFEAKDG
jgi:hypothetical protein